MDGELLRMVDALQRERSLERETLFVCIEQALIEAVKKHFEAAEDPVVKIDRKTGHLSAFLQGKPLEPTALGRIAAQATKHLIFQKIREAERDTVYTHFEGKKGDIISAEVVRFEGPHLICHIGKAEAIMLKSEQIVGESYKTGNRLRAYVLDVEKRGTMARILLSRTHENFVRKLFELEVPELTDRTIEVKGIVRDAGYRTKLCVYSSNEKVDCVGACVGVRGARIRNILAELNGENVDVIRWSEIPADFIREALKPSTIATLSVDVEKKRATVHVAKDQLAPAIGKSGRNVRLASRLTGWEIDIFELGSKPLTPSTQTATSPSTESLSKEQA